MLYLTKYQPAHRSTRSPWHHRAENIFVCDASEPWICSSLFLFTFWSFWLQLCFSHWLVVVWGTNPLECQRHPQDNSPLISQGAQCTHSVLQSSVASGGNQGGTGSNGGPSVLRNKTTAAPKNPTLYSTNRSEQCAESEMWQMYLEQRGVMGGPLEGLYPLGCHWL